MPRIADLMPDVVNNSSNVSAEWIVKFAYLLGMNLPEARKVYERNGNGCIYAKGGFAMPDTPYHRYKMVANFGDCVIVTEDGEMWQRTPEYIGAYNRKKAKKACNIERRRIFHEEQEYRERKRLQRLFKDGQTSPSPKRGGKANSHEDIGRYVNNRENSRMEFEPKAHDVFVQIHIKY